MSYDLTVPIKVVNPHADNDSLYGTYPSIAKALEGVPRSLREKGRKVGVVGVDGGVTEYWFRYGIEDTDLVPRDVASVGDGLGVTAVIAGKNIDVDSTNPNVPKVSLGVPQGSNLVSSRSIFYTYPTDSVVDSMGNLFVLSNSIKAIIKVNLLTNETQIFYKLPYTDNRRAIALDIDGQDNLYLVTNIGAETITKISPAKEVTVISTDLLQPDLFGVLTDGTIYIDAIGNNTFYKIPVGGSPIQLYVSNTTNSVFGKNFAKDLYVLETLDKIRIYRNDGTTGQILYRTDNRGALVADSAGNVFQINGNNVDKILPDGTVSTFVLTGISLIDIAIDATDNLYVIGNASSSVFKITPLGEVSIYGNSGGDHGINIHIYNNDVYVVNGGGTFPVTKIGQNSIDFVSYLGYDVGGSVVTLQGIFYFTSKRYDAVYYATLTSTTPEFFAYTGKGPKGIVLDSLNNLFIVNTGDTTISRININTKVTNTYQSGGTEPYDIAIDSNNTVYVLNKVGNFRLAKFNGTAFINSLTNITADNGKKLYIRGTDVYILGDAADNTGNYVIKVTGTTGVVILRNLPKTIVDLVVDFNDNIYLLNQDTDEVLINIAGNTTVQRYAIVGDSPNSLYFDEEDGYIYTTNGLDGSISQVFPNGFVKPFANGFNEPYLMFQSPEKEYYVIQKRGSSIAEIKKNTAYILSLDEKEDIALVNITLNDIAKQGDFITEPFSVGYSNVKVGLYKATDNVLFGTMNPYATGYDNVQFGYGMWELTTGISNTQIGNYGLATITTGSFNVAVGEAMTGNAGGNVTGKCNIGIGQAAINNLRTGVRNIALGVGAICYNETGNENIAIGYIAGNDIVSGSNNIFIGNGAAGRAGNISNKLCIDSKKFTTTANTTPWDNPIGGSMTDYRQGLISGDFVTREVNIGGKFSVSAAYLVADATYTKMAVMTPAGLLAMKDIPALPPVTVVNTATTILRLSEAFGSIAVARVDVPGLMVNVVAGKVYKMRIIGAYSSVAVTTGGSLGFALSAGTTGTIFGSVKMSTVLTNTAMLEQPITAIDTTGTVAGSFVTSTGVGAINTPQPIIADLIFTCTADGVFKVQWGTEIAASAATLLKNTIIEVIELT